ncbi:MAG TPA: phosphopyruvate hydratase [Candidatus Moranbacteria bacterium]|nr:phosphopyruvate hydratase [Candidatus Moranbacteria bacterium]HRZ33302.1 phosphopyruvate hydratase [Candidatus Moranbacteria bacterium]
MPKISKVYAREILDSRGNPTVEVEVSLDNGISAVAAVPSGASTGKFEALELRDGDEKRYGGLGVLKAVENVNKKIQNKLIGKDVFDQFKIDKIMLDFDGTENKSNLGANAILGVSLAVCKAAAKSEGLPLYKYINKISKSSEKMKIPVPMFNVLNGGKHSDSGLSIQEFKIIPTGIKKFSEQLRAGSEIFHTLKKIIEATHQSSGVGDEGGFSPKLESNTQALEMINQAIIKSDYKLGAQINLGIDAAASNFYDEEEGNYTLKPEGAHLEKERLVAMYREWIDKYHVVSIEDGLAEDDWQGWAMMTDKIAKKPILEGIAKNILKQNLLIGDDLLVTNVKRVERAIKEKACNAVLIKVNQIGTLSETLDCIKLAKKNKMKVMISHRSGETTDDFIADLAVGTAAEFIKSGSLSRGERLCKYNRLMKIEEEIK